MPLQMLYTDVQIISSINTYNLLTYLLTYLLSDQRALEELLPSNEGFFIWFNFCYNNYLLEAEWWVIAL